MPQPKQPTQAYQIIEFAKKHSNSEGQKDHYISTTAGPLMNRRIYCVEWGYDEDEEPNYWCYVTSTLDGRPELEYFDDGTTKSVTLAEYQRALTSEREKTYQPSVIEQAQKGINKTWGCVSSLFKDC